MTSVFPYLPEMIRSFGVPNDDVARWAGFTGAVFSISQSMTAVPWGRASDRFGRKPVILVGLLSTMICFVIWGMSSSLAMAISVRAIMGGGNGNGMKTHPLTVLPLGRLSNPPRLDTNSDLA